MTTVGVEGEQSVLQRTKTRTRCGTKDMVVSPGALSSSAGLVSPVRATAGISCRVSSCDQKATKLPRSRLTQRQDKNSLGHPLDSIYNSWSPIPYILLFS